MTPRLRSESNVWTFWGRQNLISKSRQRSCSPATALGFTSNRRGGHFCTRSIISFQHTTTTGLTIRIMWNSRTLPKRLLVVFRFFRTRRKPNVKKKLSFCERYCKYRIHSNTACCINFPELRVTCTKFWNSSVQFNSGLYYRSTVSLKSIYFLEHAWRDLPWAVFLLSTKFTRRFPLLLLWLDEFNLGFCKEKGEIRVTISLENKHFTYCLRCKCFLCLSRL
jgi:hypothetical protein